MSGIENIPSTTARLLSHKDRVDEISDRLIRPITFHLAPTDKCNLNCEWCSVKNRGNNELDVDQCKQVIDTYAKLGAKSMELTGGGDPLMYDQLPDIISHAVGRGLAVGLITNGIAFDEWVPTWTALLTWMRISLSGLDFDMKSVYMDIDPNEIQTFLGCSYVLSPNTTMEKIREINEVSKHLRANYVRLVPNCYSTNEIEWARYYGPQLTKGMNNFFLQIKNYKTPKMCYWRYLKPFVNADGWVYQCSTCSLFAGEFSERWRAARIDNIESIYTKGVTSFDTSPCSLCFYTDQNQLVHALLTSGDIMHGEFV